MRVVDRPLPRDEALLEQQGAELGAGLDDVDVVEQFQRLPGVVGLALEEVVARAAPQVLGLADVQGGALLVAHDVHARCGRQALGERDLVVVAARARLAEARHLLQRAHALLLQPAEEQEQQLRRGLRVLQGAVHRLHAGVEAVGERAQRAALLRAELARQAQRVERRPREGAALQARELVVEEAQVELGVVRHQHRAGRELDEARQHDLDRRRVGDRRVVDAGDAGDHLGDADARVHQRRERVDLAAALEAHGADLGDLGEAGGGAGGLEVDHGEGDAGEVVAQGLPGAEAHVHVALPGEALVALDDVGDQLVHELGRAVGDGEEARPHFAVVEGFAGLLEQGEEIVDGRECELHLCIVTPARDGCTVARRMHGSRGTDAWAALGPGRGGRRPAPPRWPSYARPRSG